jgi:hypothetical protein
MEIQMAYQKKLSQFEPLVNYIEVPGSRITMETSPIENLDVSILDLSKS